PCRVVTIPRPPGAARSPSPTLFRSAPAHVLARQLPAQRERGPRRDRTQAAQAAIEGALELAPERVVVEREDACRLGIGQRPHDRTVALGERPERQLPAGEGPLPVGG